MVSSIAITAQLNLSHRLLAIWRIWSGLTSRLIGSGNSDRQFSLVTWVLWLLGHGQLNRLDPVLSHYGLPPTTNSWSRERSSYPSAVVYLTYSTAPADRITHYTKKYCVSITQSISYHVLVMSNTIPLSTRVVQLRWSKFGYVLRICKETTSQNPLEFAIIGSNNYWERRGCHCTQLLEAGPQNERQS